MRSSRYVYVFVQTICTFGLLARKLTFILSQHRFWEAEKIRFSSILWSFKIAFMSLTGGAPDENCIMNLINNKTIVKLRLSQFVVNAESWQASVYKSYFTRFSTRSMIRLSPNSSIYCSRRFYFSRRRRKSSMKWRNVITFVTSGVGAEKQFALSQACRANQREFLLSLAFRDEELLVGTNWVTIFNLLELHPTHFRLKFSSPSSIGCSFVINPITIVAICEVDCQKQIRSSRRFSQHDE